MANILIIDDDPDILLLLKKYFRKNGFEVQTASSGKEGIAIMKASPIEIVLCDFKLPDYNGIDILQKIKIINSSTQVIIITGYSDLKTAVESLKKGAFDYVTKPLYPDEILITVNKALEKFSEASELPQPKKKKGRKPAFKFIRGESQQSRTVEKHIDLIAPTDMSVMIIGETGTGKEYVARAIHDKSERKDSNFIAIDCGALPDQLAGSELFGHIKGAFTGAIADKKGSFELATGGTLFLDEIGNLSYENQVKLLRVLQERVIKRLGDTKDIPVDVRIIVAANKNLMEAVRAGDFREDIYHRINEFKIEIAPLREKPEDVIVFAEFFLRMANRELNKEIKSFRQEVKDLFQRYYWHGNLRELRNVVKRAVLLCEGDQITATELPDEIGHPMELPDQNVKISFNGVLPGSLKEVVEEVEKQTILEVLKKTANNKSKTAEILDIDRKTLYNKLKSYKIEV